MTATEEPQTIAPESAQKRDLENAERSLIDASARGPVLTFFTTAIFWLLVSCVLGFIASLKLHSPDSLTQFGFLSYGNIWPAYNTAMIYGWCSLAGMGVATWLIGRLTRVAIKAPRILQLGAWFWNAGVATAVATILAGYNSGLEYFEMHKAARACMFIGYLLIGIWGLILFRYRRQAAPYISVWYLVGAFFWFPWIFGTASLLTSMPQVSGVMKNVVNAWYQSGLFNIWFGCIGLASAYYFIPKVINRPIYSYNMATTGFWSWIFLSGLTGMTRLSGGPVPAYLVTLSIAATILTIIPLCTVTTNFVRTMKGHTGKMIYSPTLRFTYVGTIAFSIAVALSVISSLRSVDAVTHFTQWNYGQVHLMTIGFFSMVMFGAIYYITPRLVGCEWLSRTFIRLHFLGSAYGAVTIIGLLLLGGLAMGQTLNDSSADQASFYNVIQNGSAYHAVKTYIGYVFFGLAQFIFAIHFLFMRLRIGQPSGEPTLFVNPGEAH